MVVRHMTPAVRPDDILVALRHLSGLEPSSPARVTRLAQGPLSGNAAAGGASAPGSGDVADTVGLRLEPPAPDGQKLAGPTVANTVVAGTARASAAAEEPQPQWRGAPEGQVLATCLDAGDASLAYAPPVSAYEQLPRGAERPDEVGCAREPDGRDRPNARDRAREQRVS
jgi:hypothetical protein